MDSDNKHKKRQYESRVRWNAVIIYLFATVLCFGLIYYTANLKNTIKNQRANIKRQDHVLTLTNDLIQTVNEAQAYANLYTFTDSRSQLNYFRISLKKIAKINDSIIEYSSDDTTTKLILDEILVLLQKKELIIRQIYKQYDAFNPYEEIYSLITKYQPVKEKPVLVTTTSQDTIVYKSEKKGFWKRIGNVFSPENSQDSIVLVTKTKIDTLEKTSVIDTTGIINDIQLYTEKGKREYIQRVRAIEDQYESFINSDQKISEEISILLIKLHRQTLQSVLSEVQKSEKLINKNLNISIYGSTFALVIILAFIFMIFNDIRKVARARRATEEAKKRTEEIMESRHKLLLSVSHDIKAPLSSILGYLELMEMETNTPENVKRMNSMTQSGQLILALLSNLLNYSSLDQGKQLLMKSEFNIAQLCDELANMFAPIAQNKQLDFSYHKAIDDQTFIISDPLKIKQIAGNILSNATKYTIHGTVHFGVYINDNTLILSVIDHGIGIPEDKIEEVFKPFSRVENDSRVAEGNGFGLYVVRGLIDLLNGNINVRSEVNKGTHIEIRIPITVTEKKEESNITENQIIAPSRKKLHLLLVDDDNSLLAVINAMLTKLGHTSDICRSQMEFEKFCKCLDDYDIVLTDREMGTFSGNDILRIIKTINSEKKVILMTARSEYDLKKAESEGFDGYLQKPFSIKILAELLHDNWIGDDNKSSDFSVDFPQLCEMFDNDDTAIINILNAFVESTADNLVLYNDALNNHDFATAQGLCHKMRPMFIQLEQKEAALFLTNMDNLRGQDAQYFPEWEDESVKFMKLADNFLNYLSEKYDIN